MVALGIGLSLLGSAVAPGAAQAASVWVEPLAPTTAEAQEVARFWLEDGRARLRNATPYAVRAAGFGERLATDVVPDGPPTSLPPLEGPVLHEGAAPAASGRVFFIGSDNEPHWCSGTVVNSQYRNLVATAGHCLLDIEAPMGSLGKWVFVPGYSHGELPFGLYVGKRAAVHSDFEGARDYDHDYAFANVYYGVVLSPSGVLSGVGRLADNVGAQGIVINQPLAPTVDVFGYPAGPHPDGSLPYTGETPERSTGSTFAMSTTVPRADRPIGVASPFTAQGSLGSSWLTGYASGSRTGQLNGITIGVADTDGDNRYDTGISPYFDSDLFIVYRNAASFWTGRIS